MGALKNALKRILPPPVNSFMREVNRIVALEEKNKATIDQLIAVNLESQNKISKLSGNIEQQEKQIQKQNEIIEQQIQMLRLQETYMQQQTQMLDQQMQYMQLLNNTLADIDKHLKEQSALTNKLMVEQKNTAKKQYDEQQRINKDLRACIDNTNKEITYHYFKGLHPDQYKEALEDWYYQKTGVHMDIDNPKTFNEKIQWMKLYDSTPEKTRLADKYLVRDWVKEKIGEEYLIPLLGVWDKFDDINFDELPEKFVLKCNHGSAYNIIVTNKYELDFEKTRKKINDWMNENFAFKYGFELHYKDISRKIIAEQYIETPDNDLKDYKFLCFSGEPKYIWVDKDRYTQHKRNIYDLNWNLLDKKINTKYSNFSPCEKPYNLDKMLDFARILSKDFNFVRVDFYENKGKLYFGEMTFTTSSGTEKVYPDEFAYELGQMIKLPIDNVKEMIMS